MSFTVLVHLTYGSMFDFNLRNHVNKDAMKSPRCEEKRFCRDNLPIFDLRFSGMRTLVPGTRVPWYQLPESNIYISWISKWWRKEGAFSSRVELIGLQPPIKTEAVILRYGARTQTHAQTFSYRFFSAAWRHRFINFCMSMVRILWASILGTI